MATFCLRSLVYWDAPDGDSTRLELFQVLTDGVVISLLNSCNS
jgi:hypothetical protein